MEICSKTQIKAEVQNDNMPLYNIFRLRYSNAAASTPASAVVEANAVVTLKIIGDATWDSGQSHVTYVDSKTVKIEADRAYPYGVGFTTGAELGDIFVDVESKYAITSLMCVSNQTYELEDLVSVKSLNALTGFLSGDIYYVHGLTELTSLFFGSSTDNTAITGDIVALADKTKLVTLNLRGLTALTGDINALKDSKLAENINVRNCSGITGNLNTLLDALALAGKTGALVFDGRYSGVSYIGTKNVRTQQIAFTFSNGSWTEDA